MTTTFHMSREIADQPAMLEQHAEAWQARADQLRPRLAARKHVVLVGRGTSGNACTFATYLFATMHGRHPIEFRPWVAGVTTAGPSWDDAVVLAFSASGNSTISKSVKTLRTAGFEITAIRDATSSARTASAACRASGLPAYAARSLSASPNRRDDPAASTIAAVFKQAGP